MDSLPGDVGFAGERLCDVKLEAEAARSAVEMWCSEVWFCGAGLRFMWSLWRSLGSRSLAEYPSRLSRETVGLGFLCVELSWDGGWYLVSSSLVEVRVVVD
ncbi:hypothetical protein Droror1_Dr00008282 [Drosera rotundifolia]